MKTLKKSTWGSFIFVIASYFNIACAQTTKHVYFDDNWNVTSGSNYSFYRVLKYSPSGVIYSPIKDYYRNGNLQCEVHADKYNSLCGQRPIDCGAKNGNATWYDEYGNITETEKFENGITVSHFVYLSTSNDAAKHFAHIATTKMMENISPYTGTSPAAYIKSVKLDKINNQFEITMSATWRAKQYQLANIETFSVDGILRCGKNGEYPSFIETYRNAAVRGAWSNKDIATAIKGAYMIYKYVKD